MSQNPTNYPRPGIVPSKEAALWDKICGGISMAGGLCSVAAGLYISVLIGMLTGAIAESTDPSSPMSRVPFAGLSTGIFMAIVVGMALLQFAIGYGMWISRNWAFIAAIPVYAFCGLSSAKSVVGALLSFGLVVYSILRLAGSVGPKPE